ncbi:hypothetical protein BKA70DRAFT_1233296 [Coprinopsis sp. MPI-PUGE-AT-0042]|nr:hypothetical protein BKA70DRAFT_1233296 [Coprinopsis sp. MPI-PUGE-AT-0042]
MSKYVLLANLVGEQQLTCFSVNFQGFSDSDQALVNSHTLSLRTLLREAIGGRSHTACFTCEQDGLPCDETGPQCRWCEVLGSECRWRGEAPPVRDAISPTDIPEDTGSTNIDEDVQDDQNLSPHPADDRSVNFDELIDPDFTFNQEAFDGLEPMSIDDFFALMSDISMGLTLNNSSTQGDYLPEQDSNDWNLFMDFDTWSADRWPYHERMYLDQAGDSATADTIMGDGTWLSNGADPNFFW